MYSLTIVIPAFNEEEAIGGTIQQCLGAQTRIFEISNIKNIEIIVVSDGSTDRTVEIAKSFNDVKVIVFEKNRGYGAAIKDGFRHASGNLLGFLDADGTCDPLYFADMCRIAIDQKSDIVLGSRIGPESRMPFIRKIGNKIYAYLLSFLCGRRITDIASGMRVLRRESLKHLYPLPDGMHFTPSMTARAVLNGMKLIEIPMRYKERLGKSKLKVFGDGVRFFRTIFEAVLCYRPERIFLLGFSLFFLISLMYALYPVEFYFKNYYVEEWMIYRFMICFLLGSSGFFMLCGAAVAHRLADLGPRRSRGHDFWPQVITKLFEGRVAGLLFLLGLTLSFLLLGPGLIEYMTTGKVHMHWSRAMVGCFVLLILFQSLLTGILLRVLKVWGLTNSDEASGSAHQHITPNNGQNTSIT